MNCRYFALIACLSGSVLAQTTGYPSKPIRLIVPFSAGAATDLGARNLATRLADVLGQPIVVDNRPGAGGNVATRLLIQAPADGYTLLAGGTGQVVNVHLFKDPGYDLFRDLAPVATTTSAASLLVVHESSPYKTAPELIAAARAAREPLTFGSGGLGTSAHLSGAAFLTLAQAKGVHVPFKSAAEIVQAVLGKQIDFGVPILAIAHPQVRAGKVRALAVSTATRHPLYPDVPTFSEILPGGFALNSWFGVLARSGTPPAIVQQLHAAIGKVLRTPDFEQVTMRDGSQVFISESPEAVGLYLRKEYDLYQKLVKQTGARVE